MWGPKGPLSFFMKAVATGKALNTDPFDTPLEKFLFWVSVICDSMIWLCVAGLAFLSIGSMIYLLLAITGGI